LCANEKGKFLMHTATYSPDDNKLRLYPAHRLDSAEYDRVKAAGFKWAGAQKLFVAPTWSPAREDLLLEMCGEIGDEDTTLADRAEQRAERFEGYSDNRMQDAERARKAVAEIADNIPLGQPILVGHHSERHARRDQEKIQSGMRKAVKMWETSKYWTDRAEGAIAHAKYKELPAVRHRRIKTIEADRRKVERSKAESEKWLRLWTMCGDEQDAAKQMEMALRISNVCWLHLPRKEGDRPDFDQCPTANAALTNAYPSLYAPRTVAEVVEHAKKVYPQSIEQCNRWLAHYDNRLAYERAMLAEQIGGDASHANPLADRFPFAVGGQVQVRRYDEWLTVLKVNRGANGSVSSINTTSPSGRARQARWDVASVRDYQSPSAENVAAAKAAAKLPPLCNYPGEGFAHITQAEYDKVPKDYRGYRPRAATETTGAHRTRAALGVFALRGKCDDNKRHSYIPVFITDAKRVDPPKPVPPAEPTTPAEFVREFVSPGAAEAPAEAAEIAAAEPSEVASVEAPEFSPEGPWSGGAPDHDAPSVEIEPARAPLPATADLPAPSPAADFEAMRAALKNGGVQVVVAPQLFPTPASLADEAAELLDLQPGNRLLEPSAGTGALIDAARRVAGSDLEVVAVEISGPLCQALESRRVSRVIHADFLSVAASENPGKFDRILMNPPFENAADIRHIQHARHFLRPGGRLVAICADGPRQRERLQPIASEYRPLPPGSFKSAGTMVNTALVVIDAPPG
jgi:phospholipid N-methyltransferase